MSVFSKEENKKMNPDPWFCISCDINSGTLKLPMELDKKFHPNIKFLDLLIPDSDTTCRIFTRRSNAKEAKEAVQKQFKAYCDTRQKNKKKMAA